MTRLKLTQPELSFEASAPKPHHNSDDMIRKGREKHYSGEENGFSKLTEKDIIEIRRRHPKDGVMQLAKEFGVVKATITRVVKRIGWNHVA